MRTEAAYQSLLVQLSHQNDVSVTPVSHATMSLRASPACAFCFDYCSAVIYLISTL